MPPPRIYTNHCTSRDAYVVNPVAAAANDYRQYTPIRCLLCYFIQTDPSDPLFLCRMPPNPTRTPSRTTPPPYASLDKMTTAMRIWKKNQRNTRWNPIRILRSILIRIPSTSQFHRINPYPSPATAPFLLSLFDNTINLKMEARAPRILKKIAQDPILQCTDIINLDYPPQITPPSYYSSSFSSSSSSKSGRSPMIHPLPPIWTDTSPLLINRSTTTYPTM